MRSMNRIWIGVIASGILLFSAFFILHAFLPKTDKGVERFEKEFGLDLPGDTKTIFHTDDYGAMGDGYRLYVYQLTAKGMTAFVNDKQLGNWDSLPMKDNLIEGVHDKIDGLSHSTITHKIDLHAKKGFYLIKNRYDKPLKGYDFEDLSYNNIIVGIIDIKANKIYFCTWDM